MVQALVNLAIILIPVVVMGLALLIEELAE